MKLRVRNGQFEAVALFKFVFVGVLLGEGIIFIPFFLIIFGAMALSGAPIQGNAPQVFWLLPIMVPLIVAMHALMFGGMIVLGLWLYRLRGKLEILEET